jgi:hypothetical protein
VLETFNYYQGAYIDLPVARIAGVDLVDPTTLATVATLDYTLEVRDRGLRYSANEDNVLRITDASVAGKPIRLRYVTDPVIGQVQSYLQQDDIAVLNANNLAKRMETIVVSVGLTVTSDFTEAEISTQLASYINTLASTTALGVDLIIKFLYDNQLVYAVDARSIRLSATYFSADGSVTRYDNVSSVFGSDTACYVVDTIAVVKA